MSVPDGNGLPMRSSTRDLLGVAIACLYPFLAALCYFVWLAGQPFMVPVYFVAKLVQFLFPIVWLVASGRRLEIGWSRRGLGLGGFSGLLIGTASVTLYHCVLRDLTVFATLRLRVWEKVEQIGAATPGRFALMALFISVVHSFLEEYYWRGYVFGELRRYTSLATGAWLSGFAFALHHAIVLGVYFGAGGGWILVVIFTLCVAVGGAFWAWLYERQGSLLGPWLSHFFVDVSLMLVGWDAGREHWT